MPYQALLEAGVKFYASLGNHDAREQRYYKNFNMDGKLYYTFKTKQDVRFFALDSGYMDPQQVAWLDKLDVGERLRELLPPLRAAVPVIPQIPNPERRGLLRGIGELEGQGPLWER